MKYRYSLKQFWWSWFKRDIQNLYYKIFWNINLRGLHGTIAPITGKGEFVSVYTKGKIIEIVNEPTHKQVCNKNCFDMIRIIPYEPNHGVMVEFFKDGKMHRNYLDIVQLSKDIIYASNVEQLTK